MYTPHLLERFGEGLTDEELETLRQRTKHTTARTGEFVNLWQEIEKTSNVTAYAVTELSCPADVKGTLLLGSDDGVKVWLNEEVIHHNRVHRSWHIAEDRIAVPLKSGTNSLMLKIDQASGGWGFACEFIDEPGLPIP
ncbi:MAG: hypothetical protein ACYTGL_23225 [Planctomycetota bacterium]